MATMKGAIEHDEYMDGVESRPRRQGKLKRHCARFWWLHLFIAIAIALIVILPVIFVGYPNIAQDDINKSNIIETSQIIRNPSATQLDLTLGSILETKSVFHPVLHPFSASLYLINQTEPFVTLDIPELMGKNGTAFNVSQTVKITNMGQLTAYCAGLLAGPTLDVMLKGRGGLKLGGLQTTNVNYNQKITLSGLNGFKGITVTELHLNKDSNRVLPFGANAFGNVTIPNPSVNDVAFGDISLNLLVNDIEVGNATLPNLQLTPGNNSYPLYLTSNTTNLIKVLGDDRYKCGVLPITMKGNASIYNGEVLPYFTVPLKAAPLYTTLNLTNTLVEAGQAFLVNGTCKSS